MFPAEQTGEIKMQIIAEEHCVSGAEQPRGGPVPPSSKKTPKIAIASAHPAIEAAFDRHGGGEFGGSEGDGDAPEQRKQQMVEEREAGSAGGDLLFETEGAGRRVGIHDEDEIEQTGFFDG